jgi:hypothetical protein
MSSLPLVDGRCVCVLPLGRRQPSAIARNKEGTTAGVLSFSGMTHMHYNSSPMAVPSAFDATGAGCLVSSETMKPHLPSASGRDRIAECQM